MTTTVPRTSLWPALVGSVRGTVLELGLGTDPRCYAPDVLVLRDRVEELPGGGVDAVVCSFVLCSVTDQAALLAEVHRVLRPDGRFLFAEHVGAPRGSWVRHGQDLVAGLSRLVGARCRPNRDTGAAIALAGFDIVDQHRYDLPGPFGAGIPHLAGAAARRQATEGHRS